VKSDEGTEALARAFRRYGRASMPDSRLSRTSPVLCWWPSPASVRWPGCVV